MIIQWLKRLFKHKIVLDKQRQLWYNEPYEATGFGD